MNFHAFGKKWICVDTAVLLCIEMDIRKAFDHLSDLESSLNEVMGCRDCKVTLIPCDDENVWLNIRKHGLPDIDYLCNLVHGTWLKNDESIAVDEIIYEWVAQYM